MSDDTEYWRERTRKAEREVGTLIGRLRECQQTLKTARTLITVDELAPAMHSFEIEKRNEVRRKVVEQIDAALAEG